MAVQGDEVVRSTMKVNKTLCDKRVPVDTASSAIVDDCCPMCKMIAEGMNGMVTKKGKAPSFLDKRTKK